MKIVWHIFKKDAFRLRWALAVWLALPVAQMIYVWLAPVPSRGMVAAAELTASCFALLTGIQALVSYMLVMSLLDDDSAVDSRAFWPTRPISGRQLLGAKLLGLVVLLWLAPVVVLAPWWLAHGYGWHELGKAAVAIVLTQAVITLLALPLAALSPKSGTFLVLTGLGLLANFLEFVGFPAHTIGVASGVQDSRVLLCLALWLATVAGVVAHQFLTRRTLRSAGLLVCGWACIWNVMYWWPWDFASKIDWRHESPVALNLVLQPQSAKVALRRFRNVDGVFTLKMQLSGLPAPYATLIDTARHTFTWDAQTDILESDNTLWYSDLGLVARAMVLDGTSVTPLGELRSAVAIRTTTLAERLLREAPAYSGVLGGRIMRPVVVADLPLRVGESMQRNGYGVRVEAVQSGETDRVQVVLCVFSTESESAGFMPWMGARRSVSANPEYYFLVNRHLGKIEQLLVSQSEIIGCIGTLWVHRQRFDFSAEALLSSHATTKLRATDEEIRLVKVVFRPVERFERTISTSRLEVAPGKN